ncbi:N-formylglutamate amidohydrolase [Alphaproteobacteria bacterium]|nr:N-formylglutamate amidohydrolase [Alphaproteobacteria bacterium]
MKNSYDFSINNSPLIIMTPHSGRNYSNRFLKYIDLDLKDLRNTEDYFIDQLFIPNNNNNFSYLNANFPRIFVDVNRSPLEIDKAMWEDNNLGNLFDTNSTKVINGIGVFAKYNLFGKYIYSSKVPFSEAKWRLLNFYFPYHRKIKEILCKTKEKYAKVIALDCHSMSSELVNNKTDIVISNLNNKSSSEEILNLVKKSFKKFNYNTNINYPFKGGFITSFYGNTTKNIHCLQIEVNKRLYMDENKMTLKQDSFSKLKACFENLIKDILIYLNYKEV